MILLCSASVKHSRDPFYAVSGIEGVYARTKRIHRARYITNLDFDIIIAKRRRKAVASNSLMEGRGALVYAGNCLEIRGNLLQRRGIIYLLKSFLIQKKVRAFCRLLCPEPKLIPSRQEGVATMNRKSAQPLNIRDIPAYSIGDVARYVQIPRKTIEYWIASNDRTPVIVIPSVHPPRFSFNNLVEFHLLSTIRARGVKLKKIREAIRSMTNRWPEHPLLKATLSTDGVDVFSESLPADFVNESRGGQRAFKDLLAIHLKRIEWDPELHIPLSLYPFVKEKTAKEPRFIQINPRISFGRPVIAGTAISTAVIASRFRGRESIASLADEYGRTIQEIEEAIRWEEAKAA